MLIKLFKMFLLSIGLAALHASICRESECTGLTTCVENRCQTFLRGDPCEVDTRDVALYFDFYYSKEIEATTTCWGEYVTYHIHELGDSPGMTVAEYDAQNQNTLRRVERDGDGWAAMGRVRYNCYHVVSIIQEHDVFLYPETEKRLHALCPTVAAHVVSGTQVLDGWIETLLNQVEGTFNTLTSIEEETKLLRKPCSCGGWGKWHDHGKLTPWCCRRDSIRALKSLVVVLNAHEIPYSLNGGTMLGAIRCGEFILYDYDIDIDIFGEVDEVRRILDQWHQTSDIFGDMTVTVSSLPWRQQRFSGSNMGDVHFDIGVKPTVPSLVPCVFEDVLMTCLADFDTVLTATYGQDWRVPHRWADWSQHKLKSQEDFHFDHCVAKRNTIRERYPNSAIID